MINIRKVTDNLVIVLTTIFSMMVMVIIAETISEKSHVLALLMFFVLPIGFNIILTKTFEFMYWNTNQ
ncbi:hypothetical protein C9J47_03640 [Photobacterium indicum]|jgi:predicted tellurium resistance membrane protein TerC|uniref:Uncharacterized protein n=1 Tax=Photobacterium indicum TaxID=81447 RepID=A0A2T3LE59_9GAMM|nr:hypothetical protein C9J47_03640 [Photobacterium indicum]